SPDGHDNGRPTDVAREATFATTAAIEAGEAGEGGVKWGVEGTAFAAFTGFDAGLASEWQAHYHHSPAYPTARLSADVVPEHPGAKLDIAASARIGPIGSCP